VFRKNSDNIGLLSFVGEKLFQLIDTNGWNSNDLSISFIVFSDTHPYESFIKPFHGIRGVIMGEHKPLIVVPELIHLLDKVVRIVAFNDNFYFGCNINIDEIFNVLPDFLI
jgi:hypothetical protein